MWSAFCSCAFACVCLCLRAPGVCLCLPVEGRFCARHSIAANWAHNCYCHEDAFLVKRGWGSNLVASRAVSVSFEVPQLHCDCSLCSLLGGCITQRSRLSRRHQCVTLCQPSTSLCQPTSHTHRRLLEPSRVCPSMRFPSCLCTLGRDQCVVVDLPHLG